MGKGHIPEDTFVYARVYVHVGVGVDVHVCVGVGARASVHAVDYVVRVPACVFDSVSKKCTMKVYTLLPLKFSCVRMLVLVQERLHASTHRMWTSVRKHLQPPPPPKHLCP